MTIKHPTLNHLSRGIQCCLLAFFMTSLVSCNPEEAIQQYFAEKGLNPLAILRTDVQPGTLILVGEDGTAHQAGHVLDYLTERDRGSTILPIDNCESATHCQGILSGYKEERAMNGSVALSFFYSLFQISPDVKIGLTDHVRIDQLDSTFEKIKVADLQRFLGRRTAKPLVQEVLNAIADGEKAYVAYEVHRAQRLTIASAEGKDIAPSLETKAVGEIPLSGKVDLTYKKESERQLSVESHQAYAFAVKTGELIPFPKKNPVGVRFKVTRAVQAGNIKGTDNEYAAPLKENFGSVTLMDGSNQ
ncbi:hypothetical protein [Candidatus Nitrospira salsa]